MEGAEVKIPLRTQLAVYGSGMFANSMSNISGLIVPLWVSSFGASATLVGLVFGARHILPLLLSIHGGALMDRLGTCLLYTSPSPRDRG